MANFEAGQQARIAVGYNEWWKQHNDPNRPRAALQALFDGDSVKLHAHTGPHWWVKREGEEHSRPHLVEERFLVPLTLQGVKTFVFSPIDPDTPYARIGPDQMNAQLKNLLSRLDEEQARIESQPDAARYGHPSVEKIIRDIGLFVAVYRNFISFNRLAAIKHYSTGKVYKLKAGFREWWTAKGYSQMSIEGIPDGTRVRLLSFGGEAPPHCRVEVCDEPIPTILSGFPLTWLESDESG